MITALRPAVLASIAALSLASAPAVAEPPQGTMSGTYTVHTKVLSSQNGEKRGKKAVSYMRLTPKCDTGACATRLSRVRGDGKTVRIWLDPTADGTYEGSTTYFGGCYFANGTVKQRAYKYTERISLTPVKLDGDHILTFTGVMKLTFKPTAAGERLNCGAGRQTVQLKGA